MTLGPEASFAERAGRVGPSSPGWHRSPILELAPCHALSPATLERKLRAVADSRGVETAERSDGSTSGRARLLPGSRIVVS